VPIHFSRLLSWGLRRAQVNWHASSGQLARDEASLLHRSKDFFSIFKIQEKAKHQSHTTNLIMFDSAKHP
jgi:hypothetical protein